jgi:hypothetical protein
MNLAITGNKVITVDTEIPSGHTWTISGGGQLVVQSATLTVKGTLIQEESGLLQVNITMQMIVAGGRLETNVSGNDNPFVFNAASSNLRPWGADPIKIITGEWLHNGKSMKTVGSSVAFEDANEFVGFNSEHIIGQIITQPSLFPGPTYKLLNVRLGIPAGNTVAHPINMSNSGAINTTGDHGESGRIAIYEINILPGSIELIQEIGESSDFSMRHSSADKILSQYSFGPHNNGIVLQKANQYAFFLESGERWRGIARAKSGSAGGSYTCASLEIGQEPTLLKTVTPVNPIDIELFYEIDLEST